MFHITLLLGIQYPTDMAEGDVKQIPKKGHLPTPVETMKLRRLSVVGAEHNMLEDDWNCFKGWENINDPTNHDKPPWWSMMINMNAHDLACQWNQFPKPSSQHKAWWICSPGSRARIHWSPARQSSAGHKSASHCAPGNMGWTWDEQKRYSFLILCCQQATCGAKMKNPQTR